MWGRLLLVRGGLGGGGVGGRGFVWMGWGGGTWCFGWVVLGVG